MNNETEEATSERRSFEIVINGEQHVVPRRRLTFEDVVRLDFDDATFNDDIVYTVT